MIIALMKTMDKFPIMRKNDIEIENDESSKFNFKQSNLKKLPKLIFPDDIKIIDPPKVES
jgi:hypothetical protein